jgi:hypothetical protein
MKETKVNLKKKYKLEELMPVIIYRTGQHVEVTWQTKSSQEEVVEKTSNLVERTEKVAQCQKYLGLYKLKG